MQPGINRVLKSSASFFTFHKLLDDPLLGTRLGKKSPAVHTLLFALAAHTPSQAPPTVTACQFQHTGEAAHLQVSKPSERMIFLFFFLSY